MDKKSKGFSSVRKLNSDSVQSLHPNKSMLVYNNNNFIAPVSSKKHSEMAFHDKKQAKDNSHVFKNENGKKKNHKSQAFAERSYDESSSSLMSFNDDQDSPVKYKSNKNNNSETGKVLSQSKKIKKQVPKTPSTEDDQPQDRSPKKKKTYWSSEEDALVLRLLNEVGTKWTEIGKAIGGRTGKQVRDRYLQKLRPDISFQKWTEEEDARIIALFNKYGNKWSQIAQHMKNRSESQVKNRFNTRLKRMLSYKKGQNKHFEEEEANQEQEDQEEDQEEEQEEQQQDEEEEEEAEEAGALSPIVRAESIMKLEDEKSGKNLDLIDFDEVYLKKCMRLPSFTKLTSVSIKKQNSAIGQDFRQPVFNYSNLFNAGSQPHHILPDFLHQKSKND